MTNHYDSRFIDEIRRESAENGWNDDWIVSEKVDGSNFHFAVDRHNHVRCGRRTAYIEDSENFFNHRQVLDKYRDSLKIVSDRIFEKFPRAQQYRLFGDIFGGWYPHPDVAPDPRAQRVAKAVRYCPSNDFYVFDLMVDDMYLDRDTLEQVTKDTTFLVAPVLMRGTLEQCMQFPVEAFHSILPAQFQLPTLPDNFAEGVVLSPATPRILSNGSRMIVKLKNSRFSERQASRNNGSSNEGLGCLDIRGYRYAKSFITENRVSAVASKEPVNNRKNVGLLLRKTVDDALAEAKALDVEGELPTNPDEWTTLAKELCNIARPHVLQFVKYSST